MNVISYALCIESFYILFFLFKQKTAYEMRISDWSSDVCSSDLAGAIAFVRALPPDLPRAIASSSSSAWIETHLDHLGLRADFGSMVFSGRAHVTRGKPAPDVSLHAIGRAHV